MISILKYLCRYLLSFIIFTNVILFTLDLYKIINVDNILYLGSSVLSFFVAFNTKKEYFQTIFFSSLAMFIPFVIQKVINIGIWSTKIFENNIPYIEFNTTNFNDFGFSAVYCILFALISFFNFTYLMEDKSD